MIYLEQHVFDMYEIDAGTQQECRDLVRKYLFKYTDCGASCTFEPEGVVLHTIVEGSDAFFQETLHYPFEPSAWWRVLDNFEILAEEAWNEANVV